MRARACTRVSVCTCCLCYSRDSQTCLCVDMSQGTVDSVKTAIAEGRRVAAQASKAETRAMLLETCKELDGLLAEIAALQAAGKVDD